jgi:2EXR family
MPPKKKTKKSKGKDVAKKTSQPDLVIKTPVEPLAGQKSQKGKAETIATMSEPDLVIEKDARAETTFTCFPKLPAELRTKVWKYASHVTRNIDISTKTLYLSCKRNGEGPAMPYYYVSSCPPPAILLVCKESRTEALKYYKLDFESEDLWGLSGTSNTPPVLIATPPRIYINWQVDRICMMDPLRFEDWIEERDECTSRLPDFIALCIKIELKHFATNLDTSDCETPDPFICVPLEAKLEELVLFNDPRCAFQKAFKGISFIEVSEAEGYYKEWGELKDQALDERFDYEACRPEHLRCCSLQLSD